MPRMRATVRRDKKKRILRPGESQRADGRYQYKYQSGGKPHFVYSNRLEPTDPIPAGTKPGKSLRELEQEIGFKEICCPNHCDDSMTVLSLVIRYLATRKNVKPNTLTSYNFVVNTLKKEDFAKKSIGSVKRSDAKLWLISMQDRGRGYSAIHTIRGVVRPAFQMSVDDEIIHNYFLSIADLIDDKDHEIYIPVFIGDSSIPTVNKLSKNKSYYIDTIQTGDGNSIKVEIPVLSTKNQKNFIKEMHTLALFGDSDEVMLKNRLSKLCSNEVDLEEITSSWQELKEKGLITPAVVNSMINSYLLCNIGKFDLIVGNPPWVDWKTLPSVHRENKKETCYARNLFSGDGRTGGNSLNICALISNVSAENWLAKNGVMSILMPQSLLFQQSYEGYREFTLFDGRKLYFQEIVDWSKSGHPFSPVQQLFCTYVISESPKDYTHGIPLKQVVLNKGNKLENIKALINDHNFSDYFAVNSGVVGKASSSRSAFTYAKSTEELEEFNSVTGESMYIGREGVEYYPQELQLLRLTKVNTNRQTVELESYQSTRSKISVGKRTPELETKYLRPLIKGINITRFNVAPSEFIVAFPYDKTHSQVPLNKEELLDESPKLLQYYESNKEYLTVQTEYSDKIIGKKEAPYYALARTGKYCHADWYVIFRDNTKWVSAVTGAIDTEWGGRKRPAFQNHCVSICEKSDGTFITEDEAHYICAILNSHIVEDYILSTSDKRTFKIRIPVRIEEYDKKNAVHLRLVELSKKAHDCHNEFGKVEMIRSEIDKLYLESLR